MALNVQDMHVVKEHDVCIYINRFFRQLNDQATIGK